jgi:hypothetical protein
MEIESGKRFELTDPKSAFGSSKIRNWVSVGPDNSIGSFLAKLWSIFGQPQSIDFEGFTYIIHDKITDLVFRAYCGSSGPAYGGQRDNVDRLLPVLDLFDAILEQTPLADCEIEFETDFGIYKTGSKNGESYGKTLPSDLEDTQEGG